MPSSQSYDTEALLSRASIGDVRARSALLDRHRARLCRMVAVRLDRRVRTRIDPSDVVQEALAEASQKLSDYLRVRPVPFYPWLRRLAWEHLVRIHERHVEARRRSVAREQHSMSALPDESAYQLIDQLAACGLPPDHRLVEAELKSRFLQALAQLPEADRELLVLRHLEQASNREIAELLQLNEPTVRKRHVRALDRLTRIMERLDRHEERPQ